MLIRGAFVAVIGAISLSACSANAHSSPSVDDKYKQTWTLPYSQTTCADYLNEMSSKQRWVMAADMLTAVRKVDGGSTLPSDGDVTRFEGDVATACEGEATAKPRDVAVAVYKLDPSYAP